MPQFEKILSSSHPFSGRLIKLRVDEVILPNGRKTTREIVEHGGAVAVLALQGDRVLMERQYRHTAERVMWEIPAGTIEEGEEPRDCAIRELREETGYEAEKIDEIIHFYVAVGYSTEVIRIFLATGLKQRGATLAEDEQIETVLLPLGKALQMVKGNEIEDAKTIIGLLFLKDRLNDR